MNSYFPKKGQTQGSCDFSGTATVGQTAPSMSLWAWTFTHQQFLWTKYFTNFNFLFLDDWFIAVASTSSVYPASSRYIFLILTSNNKSLSFWVYILVYFLMKGKIFSCYFQTKNFLTSVECESGLKFVENFVFVYVGTYFPCPRNFFFRISAQRTFLFLLVIDSSYWWILLVKSLLPCSLFCDI